MEHMVPKEIEDLPDLLDLQARMEPRDLEDSEASLEPLEKEALLAPLVQAGLPDLEDLVDLMDLPEKMVPPDPGAQEDSMDYLDLLDLPAKTGSTVKMEHVGREASQDSLAKKETKETEGQEASQDLLVKMVPPGRWDQWALLVEMDSTEPKEKQGLLDPEVHLVFQAEMEPKETAGLEDFLDLREQRENPVDRGLWDLLGLLD